MIAWLMSDFLATAIWETFCWRKDSSWAGVGPGEVSCSLSFCFLADIYPSILSVLIKTGDYAIDPGNTFVLGEKSLPGFNCTFSDSKLCTLCMFTYGTVVGPVD